MRTNKLKFMELLIFLKGSLVYMKSIHCMYSCPLLIYTHDVNCASIELQLEQPSMTITPTAVRARSRIRSL